MAESTTGQTEGQSKKTLTPQDFSKFGEANIRVICVNTLGLKYQQCGKILGGL